MGCGEIENGRSKSKSSDIKSTKALAGSPCVTCALRQDLFE